MNRVYLRLRPEAVTKICRDARINPEAMVARMGFPYSALQAALTGYEPPPGFADRLCLTFRMPMGEAFEVVTAESRAHPRSMPLGIRT